MKSFLFSLLPLLGLLVSAQAQTELSADSAARPRAGRYRQSVVGGRTYIKGATGNAIPQATLPEVQVRVPFLAPATLRAQNVALTAPLTLFSGLKSGDFVLDLADRATPDDGATTLIDGAGNRYKRVFHGYANAAWWGADGKNTDFNNTAAITATTAALQAAINYLTLHSNPALYSSTAPNMDRRGTLYIPAGTYIINLALKLRGALHIIGEEGLSYAGSLIYQRNDNEHLFVLTADDLGGSGNNSCVTLENIRLRQGTVPGGTTALVYINNDGSYGSPHFYRVWFQNWNRNAVWCKGSSDDGQVQDCIFDGTDANSGPALELGNLSGTQTYATNWKISGNTIFNARGGFAHLVSTKNILLTNNRAYKGNDIRTPYFVDALSGNPASLTGLSISSNTLEGVNVLLKTQSGGFSVVGNTVEDVDTRVLEFGGGGVVTGGLFANNVIFGNWTGTIGGQPDAPIFALNTGVVGLKAVGNTITATAGNSPTPVNLADSRSTGNIIDPSGIRGFTGTWQINTPLSGKLAQRSPTINSGTIDVSADDAEVYNLTASGSVTAISAAYVGQTITVYVSAPSVTFVHGSALLMPSSVNLTLTQGQALTFKRVAGAWYCVSAPTPPTPAPDLSTYVQGQTAGSKAVAITGGTFTSTNLPFSQYAIGPNVSGMPTASTNWLTVVSHHEDPAGPGGGTYWTATAANLFNPAIVYQGARDGGSGNFVGWRQYMIAPAGTVAGDLFYYDGTVMKRIPKGTDGQMLKMVNGVPAWSN